MTDQSHDFAAALLPDLATLTGPALQAAETVERAARQALAARIGGGAGSRIPGAALEADQHAAHGLAWLATYVEALRQLHAWAGRLDDAGLLGEVEALILQIGFGEYLAQIDGGIAMSQGEVARLADMGVVEADRAAFRTGAGALLTEGNTDAARRVLAARLGEARGAATFGATGLDPDMEMIRDHFRRFADERVVPHAHGWHLGDALIPIEVLDEMAGLGVFGLTIPEEFGGAGMGKTAMCVVSEELSRGYIGVGSLGTRSEIAAELILGGGTAAQKARWLPAIASGEVLPTAVFTEPGTGSDLGALRTRATRDGDDWVLAGNKTWITHAARTDLMTVLARTDPATDDYSGLSMFLAEKTRGTDAAPFPDETIAGGEIEVLGYRGMKEYTLALDDHRVPGDALLGGQTGQGFRQLMRTFESARIQTAARAIGVAQNALELSLAYAADRAAFGKPIAAFPRVYGKLAMMAVEIMIARQLSYHAAREKDAGRRCDLEAGMAKLLGARVAWAAADNGVQIHGGNGFALEYPISRVLCDARILSIFEGAAEIQAQVIARRLLESRVN
ncbi:acyl-CoA dehydrogenase [Rhodobacteraceae bacterium 2CG4]|uniref:Acyl-CoA dehydrogenase n=1 Tax=Halovulum marinum TaxID=2662447 RepID=A0A6L5YUN1_9RHOB|nr:acyl-CoA dehydrogenase family protein [Halovulum marinum]MSU88136.1 acyl-CoA dehydrogenase [Halovulum marinum]